MTMPGAGIPYVDRKQRVLCQFRALYRYGASTRTEHDALVIKVEHSSQIEDAFLRAAAQRLPEKPIELVMTSYLPECGRAVF